MSTAKQIIKGALLFRGSDSSAMPADATFFADGFIYLLGLLAKWEGQSLTTGITIPVDIDSDLNENDDLTIPLYTNLGVSLLFIRKPIDRDQFNQAKSDKENISITYVNAGFIPEQLFPTTTPKGEGNFTGPYSSEFFSNPDAVLNNQTGALTAPVDPC